MKTAGIILGRFILMAWIAALAGCATISSGTTQAVSFQTSPEDVLVTMITRVRGANPEDPWHDESRILGKTPLTVQLDKEEGRSITLSHDGYKPITLKLTTSTDPNFWGNIALGGLIGSTTDSMSGAIIEYSPSQYFVTLTPNGGNTIENATLKSDRDKVREFIVGHYSNLMANISQGGGEDLNAVLRLLHVPTAQEADARRKIRALSEVYTEAPAFADRVTDLYLK